MDGNFGCPADVRRRRSAMVATETLGSDERASCLIFYDLVKAMSPILLQNPIDRGEMKKTVIEDSKPMKDSSEGRGESMRFRYAG